MIRRLCVIAAAASSLLACGDDAATQDPGPDADMSPAPRAEAASCRFDVPASLGLTEGVDSTCGDLIPEETRATHDNRVRLHFIRFKSSATTGRATIFLEGGPGGDGQHILDVAGEIGVSFLTGLLVDGDFVVLGRAGRDSRTPVSIASRPPSAAR
jgi:hypothetical protein